MVAVRFHNNRLVYGRRSGNTRTTRSFTVRGSVTTKNNRLVYGRGSVTHESNRTATVRESVSKQTGRSLEDKTQATAQRSWRLDEQHSLAAFGDRQIPLT
jgi:hypothetical protein